MECNKEEAIRAKNIAEKKMIDDDFQGARKFLLKAKNLFPGIENISQLLAVCDVHCSAQNSIYGSEKDWYGVLQINKLADEAIIRKQYRKLALLLHPDKNKYPRAEAAFKLICQANMVLSDKGNRSVYDAKCRVPVRPVAPKPPSNNVIPVVPKRPSNNVSPRFEHGFQRKTKTSNVQHQPSIHSSSETFWTVCPFCATKFQYYRTFLSRSLRCQNCSQPFLAYEIGNQGPTPFHRETNAGSEGTTHVSNGGHPPVSDLKKNAEKTCQMGAKSSREFPQQRFGSVGNSSEKMSSGLKTGTGPPTEAARGLKNKINNNAHATSEAGNGKGGMSKADPTNGKQSGHPSIKNKNKRRKFAVNSSESFDSISDSEEMVFEEVSNIHADTSSSSEPEIFDCPEPEFSDFDKEKDERCFSVDQIWACYDTIDGMPRFYAQIKKVFSPGFKLRFTWLEADPQTQDETDWVSEGLPVGCGKFVRGETEDTSERLTFSHQIYFVKGSRRGSYLIYPRSGEIWALFRDWDIKWSSDSKNPKRYVFEIVEVLSDFSSDTNGIKVIFLTKLKGFVSLFERTRGAVELLIPSRDLLRFSHRIPSFKMTGTEREGVPEGSYELDPAALPTDPNECWQPEVVETQSTNVKVTGPSSKSFDEKVKSTNGFENAGAPKISADFQEMDCSKEVDKLQQSPRDLNITKKKSDHVSSSPCLSQEGTAKHLHGSENAFGCFTASKRKASSGQGAKVSEEVFYDFNLDKSEGKFQPGQIWALYSTMDKLPNNYGQIKQIETSPFKLHVAFFEPCTYKQPVCCGMFRFQNGKPKILLPSSFSHLMNVEVTNKTKIEIYPKRGEIWAIYKSWNSDLSCPGLKNCKFDIVEIVKNDESCTEVACLVRLTGFKSVFRAQRGQSSNTGSLMIPRNDLFRFSHQIPACQLTGEKDGSLRGLWELDSAALPSHMF